MWGQAMSAESEDGLTSEQRFMLEATFKTWDFLEESGFEVDELVGKDVSFILGTPDGGGRRLGINNLLGEIDKAASEGEACEACFLEALVRDSKGSVENPPWEDARFPVSHLPPRQSEKAAGKFSALREEPAKPLGIKAFFFPKRGLAYFVKLPFSELKAHLPKRETPGGSHGR